MASKALVEKFRVVVEEEFGKSITLEEAGQILGQMVGYFDLLAQIEHRPVPVAEDQMYGQR